MGRSGKMLAAAAAALAGTQLLGQEAFVPSPARAPAAAAAAVAGLAPAAALADPIGDAAKKLGDVSYPFAKSVDWYNPLFLKPPGSFQPEKALTAIDKMIVMGAKADAVLLKKAAEAHHKAILSIGASKNGVASREAWDEVNAALGRVIASVPEEDVMAVYNAVADITDPAVPAYLKGLADGPKADAAYSGLLAFANTVKAQNTGYASFISTPKGDAIDVAAKELSEAAYPFLKEIDWKSDLYFQPLPGITAKQALKAVDKAIVMGSKMGPRELKLGAEAHHKAIMSMDASGVTSLEDFTAVNAAIGRMIVSTPTSKVMDVYNAFAGIVKPEVPSKLMSGVNSADAQKAYNALLEFKDVVKAEQAAYKAITVGWSFAGGAR